jgi:hypothetical protein
MPINFEPFSLYSPVEIDLSVRYVAEDVSLRYFRTKIVNSTVMMRIVKTTLFFSLVLSFMLSCKKEEEQAGTCFDGVMSPGELGIDCGGVCPPCGGGNSTQELLLVKLNGVQMQFTDKSLIFEDGWIFRFWNDTVDVRLNFGQTLELGSAPIEQPYCSVISNSQLYEDLNSGFVLFTNINQSSNRASGYFEAKFVGYFLDSMIVDTFYIQNGDFENVLIGE